MSKPLPPGYHTRYSISGSGRNAITNMHAVENSSRRTICGRNAFNWNEGPAGENAEPECLKCLEALRGQFGWTRTSPANA